MKTAFTWRNGIERDTGILEYGSDSWIMVYAMEVL
jgi:hypothetical protein